MLPFLRTYPSKTENRRPPEAAIVQPPRFNAPTSSLCGCYCYNISNSQRTVHRLRRNLTGVRTFQNHTILHTSIILHPCCCNRLCGAHAHTYTLLSTSLGFGRLSSRDLSHGSPSTVAKEIFVFLDDVVMYCSQVVCTATSVWLCILIAKLCESQCPFLGLLSELVVLL